MSKRGGVVFVLVMRSCKVVPEELVTLMTWDLRDLLSFFSDGRGRMCSRREPWI